MILGIQMPEDAKIETTIDGKVLIIFDENKSRRDLWKANFWMWVTEGNNESDFFKNPALDNKNIELSYRNKLRMGK